ncbi:protein of unknown function [Hyphomicrobium sp. 1Nfss2.1]|uniref:hypothetical protein n=1 Tax=Hyphomicrobium sp. 1Nfss2.1 TaxID=3413936 RepID=UPI003C79A8BE
MTAKFAGNIAAGLGELRYRDTRAVIAKFAIILGHVSIKSLKLRRTSRAMRSVPVVKPSSMLPMVARGAASELWRNFASGH